MTDYGPALQKAISGHNIESYGGIAEMSIQCGIVSMMFRSLPHFREECEKALLRHYGAPTFRVGSVEVTWQVCPLYGQEDIPDQFLADPAAMVERFLSLVSADIPWGWGYFCHIREGDKKDKIVIYAGRRFVGDLDECSEDDRCRVITRGRPVVDRISVILGDPVRIPQNDGYRSALWESPTEWAVEYALR
jgi:hypothetical protein